MAHRASIVSIAPVNRVPLLCVLPLGDSQLIWLAASLGALTIGFFLGGLFLWLGCATVLFLRTVICRSVSVSHNFTVEQEVKEGNWRRINCPLFDFSLRL